MNGIDQAIIIAAGRVVRMGLLTKDRPKPMLPVLGKPILIRLMDRMREAGIRNFIVVVGENDGEVASYLNGGWAPDCKIQIVLLPISRGPAEALAQAAKYITGPFIVASCDHLTPPEHIPSLIRRFNESQADMVLSLTPYNAETGLPVAVTDMDQVLSVSQDAPKARRSLSPFMLYACSKAILNYTGGGVPNDYEMTKLIQSVIAAKLKVTYLNSEWYMPIMRELDLLTINKRFLREGRDTHILSEILPSVHITPPVRIDPQVSIGQGAKIGPNVYLESGAQVGANAVIWDSIVLNKAEIAPGEVLHGQIVLRRQRIAEPVESEGEKTRPTRPSGLDEYLATWGNDSTKR